MGKNNTFIEINGKRYDARTGTLLDGRPAHLSHGLTPTVKKPSMHDVVRRPGRHAQPHTPKTARTLMRHSVKKPAAQPGHLKAQGHTDSLAKKSLSDIVAPKPSVSRLDQRRLQQAKKVSKSRLISHFGSVTSDTGGPGPALAAAAHAPNNPRTASVAASHHKTQPGSSQLIEHALRHATSHEHKPLKKPARAARRRTGLALASVAGIALIGLVFAQEVPNFRLHMASAKAGFDVSLPAERPAGYSLGQLNYSPGVAATTFHSNSDSRSYTITQKASPWDSASLRDSFVKPLDPKYQAIESGGQTIFIYGDHNATWVNGGIWYTVQSNGSLSDRQLVDIANSL